jgi:hypothetical protein
MPNWKKLILSGSDAALNSLNVTTSVTAASFTGSFSGSVAAPGSTTQVVFNNGGILSANSGFVYSGSNVGIGNTSPGSRLVVQGSGTTSGSSALNVTNSTPTSLLFVRNDGNVGIGITSPVSVLHVLENTTSTNDIAGITIQQSGTGDAVLQYLLTGVQRWVTGIDNSDSDKFKIASSIDLDTNARLTITNTGLVGIGTTSPTDTLDVFSSVNNSRLVRISHPVSPTAAAGFLGFNSNGTTDNIMVTLGVQLSSAYYNVININRSTQNVGINTLTPTSRLQIQGSGTTSATSALNVTNSTPTSLLFVRDDGFVGIGTTSPSQKLHVSGSLRVEGAYYDSNNSSGSLGQVLSSTAAGTDWVSLSEISGVDGSGSGSLVSYWVDNNTITGSAGFFYNNSTNTLTVPSLVESSAERFKTNISPLTGSLDKIQEMQGVTFYRDNNPNHQEIGFIADHVVKIYPELISYDDDNQIYGLQYPRITAILVEGIKELTQQIQNQNIFIQDLKSRIEGLENK